MIRLSITHKIFLLFSLVTFFTFLLGALLYTGIREMGKVNDQLDAVRSFHFSIQQLENFHTGIQVQSSAAAKTDNFMKEFLHTRALVSQLTTSDLNRLPLQPSRLETIREYLEKYRKAFVELTEKNDFDRALPEKNLELLHSLLPHTEQLPLETQVGLYASCQKLMQLQSLMHHTRNYQEIGKARKIAAEIDLPPGHETIRETIGQFVRNLEDNYLNYLGITDRKKFLAETAAIFSSYAADTTKELLNLVNLRRQELIRAIVVITLAALLFTIIVWRFTSRYFQRFLQNQKKAITAIQAAEFDYTIPENLPNDELGELTRFMKNLAGELKNNIRKISESEREYRKLVENISDWVWETDLAGRFSFSSPAARRLTGYDQREILGRSIFDLLPHASLQKKIAAQQPVAGLEISVSHKDGHQVVLETSGNPIFDNEKKNAGYQGISRDITYRKKAEEEKEKLLTQLLQAQKMEGIGRLSGGIAHDFNNMLTSILGYCDLALLDLEEETPLRHKIEVIRESGERATALTRQLLAFSRKQTLKMEVLNLNSLISGTASMLRRMIGEDVDLLVQHDPNIPNILADPVQIEQVLMNLAVNARDAMPHGGRLTLATATLDLDEEAARFLQGLSAGEHAVLSVTDTGEGIPKELQEKIFEPFFTTKEKGKGTGLGLATTYGIVKQHRGHISVYSEPGQRTTFIIYFPATHQKTEPEPKKSRGPSLEMPRGHETILVVDDEPLVLNLAADTLKSSGYTVLKAANGAEAMEIFHRSPGISLLLTDVIMPGMNGKELALELLAIKPELKIAFMSGYASSIFDKNEQIPGSIFFNKPLSTMELTQAIRNLLDRRHS
jgi:PAS domain S-box-containing protein